MSFFGIDPEQGAGRAVPEELADRTGGFRCVLRRRDAHREVDAETHLPLAWQPRLVGDFLRHGVGGHELHGLGLEDARATQLAAAQQHARELHVVVERGHEAEAAGLERPGGAIELVRLFVRSGA